MKTTRLKHVTIIGEECLEEDILKDIHDLGATGYTYTVVHGRGATGLRPSTWTGPNAKIEVIATPEVASRILERIAEHYIENSAVIAYVNDVEALHGEKFKAVSTHQGKP